MPRVRILFNPRAGGLRGARIAGELARELRGLGADCDDGRPTDAAGYDSVRPGAQDALVVLGGDGTFHDALNRLDPAVLETTALSFLGLGTVNVLSLAADLPRDPAALARLVVAGHTVPVPIARAGDRSFLLFLEAGFGADAIVRANRWAERPATRWLLAGGWMRRPRKKALIGLAGLVSALVAWGRPLEVGGVHGLDGVRASDVLVTRVREYGGRMFLPVEVGLDEPRFEVLAFTSRWPLTHLLVFALLASGLVERAAGLLERWGLLRRARADALRLRSATSVSVFADAETLTSGPEVACRFEPPRTLHLIVPAGWSPHRSAQMRSK